MSIKNRYEILFYLSCRDANPNGDPDMGNMPRMHPDSMLGYITDVSIKRRIRDYIEMAHSGEDGMNIFVQSGSNLNYRIAKAKELAGKGLSDKSKEAIEETRRKACELYYDVRTFGAVMATGPNGGQVRGPIQFAFGRSLDAISPQEICITRVAAAEEVKNAKSAEDYKVAEEKADEDKLRTMGRKQFVPYGLYEVRGFISANDAKKTGFDDADLDATIEALANMYDSMHSASKGQMTIAGPVIIFKHVGEDSLPEDSRAKRALLGCASSQALFELVDCHKKADVITPMSHKDYECSIALSQLPSGIEVGFRMPFSTKTVWGQLPENADWLKPV